MAVIVMLALLGMILIYVAVNVRSLYTLEWELKLTEQRQLQRLKSVSAANAAARKFHASDTNSPQANEQSRSPVAENNFQWTESPP